MKRLVMSLVVLALSIATFAMAADDFTIRTFIATSTTGSETTYPLKRDPAVLLDPTTTKITDNTATPSTLTYTTRPGDVTAAFRITEDAIATSSAQTNVLKFYWSPSGKTIQLLYKDATGTVYLGSTTAMVQQ